MKAWSGHNIYPIVRLWGYFQMLKGSKLRSPSQIWSKFKLIQALMVVLITCKNEEDPIKNECARAVTTLYINF